MAQKKPSALRYLRHMWNSQDIRRKLLITLGLLAIFRLAANVPAPGVDPAALEAFIAGSASTGGNFLNFLDLLSGGTISNFSLLSMGVYPYITAQIIIQLLVPIIPALQRRVEDDPREGRKWMEKWTYYLAVPMAALSAIGQIQLFNQLAGQTVVPFGLSGDLLIPSLATLLAMTGGTMFAIWLGELISEYGIRGQGLSLIIFAGIVARMPSNLASLMGDEQNRWILLGAGTPQCAGHVPRPPHGQSHVHAGERHPAAHGQHGRYDSPHLRQRAVAIPGHHLELFHRLRNNLGEILGALDTKQSGR